MGTIAARKARKIAANVANVLAIEIMCAAQGIDFLAPLVPGKGTGAAHRAVRERVAHLDADRILSSDIDAVREILESGDLLRAVEAAVGELE